MKKIPNNHLGVSPIIATIMLTLIVVVAASTFAIFIAQQQEEYQEAEKAKLQRELENIRIMGIENIEYNSSDYLHNVEFIITNLNDEDSIITNLHLNNYVIKQFIITNQDTSKKEVWNLDYTNGKFTQNAVYANDSNLGEPYIFNDVNYDSNYSENESIIDRDPDLDNVLASPTEGNFGYLYAIDDSGEPYLFRDFNTNKTYDQNNSNETIKHDDIDYDNKTANPKDGDIGSFYPGYQNLQIDANEHIYIEVKDIEKKDNVIIPEHEKISLNDAITFEISTRLLNTFERTFYPPTAIIKVTTESQWNSTAGSYTDFIILDGSSSDHPDENAFIVNWTWTIENYTNPDTFNWSGKGRKLRAEFDDSKSDAKYWIILQVTDNYGMANIEKIKYYH